MDHLSFSAILGRLLSDYHRGVRPYSVSQSKGRERELLNDEKSFKTATTASAHQHESPCRPTRNLLHFKRVRGVAVYVSIFINDINALWLTQATILGRFPNWARRILFSSI